MQSERVTVVANDTDILVLVVCHLEWSMSGLRSRKSRSGDVSTSRSRLDLRLVESRSQILGRDTVSRPTFASLDLISVSGLNVLGLGLGLEGLERIPGQCM